MITIKQIKDYKVITDILKEYDELFPRSLSSRIEDLPSYAKKLSKNAIIYCAYDENKLLGFAAMYANDKINKKAFLAQIAVNKKYRGLNVGKSLLYKCFEKSRIEKMKFIELEVDSTNIKAIKFYEKLGFLKLRESSKDSIQMTKSLSIF